MFKLGKALLKQPKFLVNSNKHTFAYGSYGIGEYQISLKKSKIRAFDIGKNYFSLINPRRKKYLSTLLDSYCKNENNNNDVHLEQALDIFFKSTFKGRNIKDIKDNDLDLPLPIINHLYFFTIFDRISSQLSRKDYLFYQTIIDSFESKPPEKRNKVKYVFTSHPTQPNSLEQLKNISLLLRGLEENDMDFLDFHLDKLIQATNNRVFVKPSYLEESITYHSLYLKYLIKALENAYDLGFRSLSDYIEIPGTWMAFDFDNHPGMESGIMTYTNGLLINITVHEYKKLIETATALKSTMIDVCEFSTLIGFFDEAMKYGQNLQELSNSLLTKKIDKKSFFKGIEQVDLYKIEQKIYDNLKELKLCANEKVRNLADKIMALFNVFKLTGACGQIRLAGEDLLDKRSDELKPIIHDILKEASLLQTNGRLIDMIIIANYTRNQQYELLESLLDQYKITNIEIVPLLEKYSSQNESPSKITMIASSDTRQRDGLILTELRTLKEYEKNPNRFIYMGQGITAERGGGPYKLIHLKYQSLTKSQRKRHIRTVQGHYFTSEFANSDLAFSFIFHGLNAINAGDDFVPTSEYLNFLEELDEVVGIPQREMQKTDDYNNLYVKNQIVKTLADTFNYSGSREMLKPLIKVKNQRAIVQAYINSDRCSFTHPELAFWEKLNENQIAEIARFYHDNNQHIKYMLYMYIFMVQRYDLEFAVNEVGIDTNNEIYKSYVRGKKALEKILNYIGISKLSLPANQMWKEHLGLQSTSTDKELIMKENCFRNLIRFQNYQVKKYVREQILNSESDNSKNGEGESASLRKLRTFQCILANITSFHGKG